MHSSQNNLNKHFIDYNFRFPPKEKLLFELCARHTRSIGVLFLSPWLRSGRKEIYNSFIIFAPRATTCIYVYIYIRFSHVHTGIFRSSGHLWNAVALLVLSRIFKL